VHLNLFLIQYELYKAKDTLNSQEAAIELVRNVALAEKKDNEVLKKVFDRKVKNKEMVLLFDSLDEVSPMYSDTTKRLFELLRETDLQIVVTTRPHEGKLFMDAETFELEPLLTDEEKYKFIEQKFQSQGKSAPKNTEAWLKKVSGSIDREFWSKPLNLRMAVDMFGDNEEKLADSEMQTKSNCYRVFLNECIKGTLSAKFDVDEKTSLARDIMTEQTKKYNELIEILAVCAIFHAGTIQQKFRGLIKKNGAFVNRFPFAKLDEDYKHVIFLQKSFAEYLVARLFVKHEQETKKTLLCQTQLKSILFDHKNLEIRKHVCGILATFPTREIHVNPVIIEGEEKKLLKLIIQEDCYELYKLLKEQLRCVHKRFVLDDYEGKRVDLLYLAMRDARKEFVQELIADGADIETTKRDEFFLHLAVRKGLHDHIFNYHELKLNVNKKDDDGFNPLHYATRQGSKEITKFLIENGADVNAESKFHKTALYYAIEANSAEVVELLIDKKADLTNALQWAVEFDRDNLCDLVYEKAKDEFEEALLNAALKGRLEVCKYLCDRGADPTDFDKYGESSVHIAAIEGHLECVQYFLAQQQSVDIKNKAGETPLMKALSGKYEDMVMWLLDQHANVNAADQNGTTCLQVATSESNMRCIEMLIDASADLNAKDNDGRTVIFYAVYRGDAEILNNLLKWSTNPELTDSKNNTCLHIACENCSLECVELLLEYDVPIDCQNKRQETPLHLAAAREKDADIFVKYLLDRGANPDLKNVDG
jgi:ankyrin repeat protein